MSFTRPTTALLPPSIRDERSIAFMSVMQEALQEPDFKKLLTERIDSVESTFLPALIRELSCEEFIEQGMSEVVIRRLLKRAYELHESKGYLYGIRLGLSLLGMKVHWTQWYKHTPMRKAGTHKAIVYANEYLFDNQGAILDLRTERAALRMINGMKRWSQDVDFSIGIGVEGKLGSRFTLATAGTFELKSTIRPRVVFGAITSLLHARATALLPLKVKVMPLKTDVRTKSQLRTRAKVQTTLILPLHLHFNEASHV